MNAHRSRSSAILISVFAAVLLVSWIGSPPPGLALMALPDIGIMGNSARLLKQK